MDETTDYRPATRRDYRKAAENVDASELTPYEREQLASRRRTERVEETRVVGTAGERPFSVAAGFFGWAVASFFTLVLGTFVLGAIGATAFEVTDEGTTIDTETFNSLTTTGLLGLAVAILAAYFLGGYAAGRIGLWHGAMHGVAIVVWTVLFSVLAIAAGVWLGDAADALLVIPAIDWSELATPAVLGILLALVVMFAGAILGGVTGARRDTEVGLRERWRTRRVRGRPL